MDHRRKSVKIEIEFKKSIVNNSNITLESFKNWNKLIPSIMNRVHKIIAHIFKNS